jgi:M6 family metalloprotease-like protein
MKSALKTSILILTCLLSLNLQAAFLNKVPQTLTQPDGTILKCFASGDEHNHWLHDANNYTILQDAVTGFYVYATKSGNKLVATSFVAGITNPATAGLQAGVNLDSQDVESISRKSYRMPETKGTSGTNTTGTINNIVIFIRFADQDEFSVPASSYYSAFNGEGSSSMMEYFKEISGSQLTINTSLFPQAGGSTVSYQDTHNRNYYCSFNSVTNPDGYADDNEKYDRELTLLKNATEAVKPEIESAGQNFDNDNNGLVDNICYIIKGSTDGWSGLLWPHMFKQYYYDITLGGAKVMDYNLQISESMGVNVLCHEMAHTLGFPDLYRYADNTINPVSSWDVMASTTNPPQHPSVYMKAKYGNWTSGVNEISSNGTYTLDPLSSNPFAAYKISSPNSTSEYFMVEYRKTAGLFESQLLGSGLIIYRVVPSVNGNMYGAPDEVYVFRPNGTTTSNGDLAEANFTSDAGRTAFGGGSNTTCFLSNGMPGGFKITDIGTAGESISFTVSFGNDNPAVLNVAPGLREVPVAAGVTSFGVSNTGGGTMAWTASVTSGASWAHITSGNSGSNAGSVEVAFDANMESDVRTASINVSVEGSSQTLYIVQEASRSVLNAGPEEQQLVDRGGVVSYTVANLGGGNMNWTASVTTGSSWAKIVYGLNGSNAGTIRVEAAANTGAQREAIITVTVGGSNGSRMSVNLVQDAKAAELMINPTVQTVDSKGDDIRFEVAKTGYGMINWATEVTTGATWAHITIGNSGSNDGIISVEVDENTGAPRTASIIVKSTNPSVGDKILTINQDIKSSISVVSSVSNLNIYPNPVVNQCTVQIENFDGATKTLEVFNMMGQLQTTQLLSQESTSVDMAGLSKGVYVFRITSENKIVSQSRVVKE